MRFDDCNGFIYVVQEDDSLYSISRRFNIPLAWLINSNREDDIYNLYVGKRICIPNRDPGIEIIPIVPIRPWPGNIGGPGPVLPPYVPYQPFRNQGPYNDPRDPRYGNQNPFGVIGDNEEEDEYESVAYNDYDDMYDDDDVESTENGNSGTPGNPNPGVVQVPYVVINYVVKRDDNLADILERFGLNMDEVLRYNDTIRIFLKPGTVIRVPNKNPMDDQKYEPR